MTPGASGGEFVQIDPGVDPPEVLSYLFQPLYPAQYEVWVRYRSELEVDAQLSFAWNSGSNEELWLEPAEHWSWVKLGSWIFEFGDHVLQLRDLTPGVGLDRLFITRGRGRTPLAKGPRAPDAAPGQTHEEWAQNIVWLHPGVDDLEEADPDADGLCNAWERLFGLDPLKFSPRPMAMARDKETGSWICRFQRDAGAGEMEPAFVVSTDLVEWRPAEVVRSIAVSETELEVWVVPGDDSQSYLRLDLSLETP